MNFRVTNQTARFLLSLDERGRLGVDYDPQQQPIFEKIREAIRTLEAESGFKTWAIKRPITVH